MKLDIQNETEIEKMNERLTVRDEFGNADIIGVDSQELQLNLYGNEFNKVTEALNKLAHYEEAEQNKAAQGQPCEGAELGLNSFAAEVHKNAALHGWWEEERSVPEILMLCVSELSEALEEYRSHRPQFYYPCATGETCVENVPNQNSLCGLHTYNPNEKDEPCIMKSKKPKGLAVELADCIIRILDYCGAAGIDIEKAISIKHEYNKTRPYRHGGKKC